MQMPHAGGESGCEVCWPYRPESQLLPAKDRLGQSVSWANIQWIACRRAVIEQRISEVHIVDLRSLSGAKLCGGQSRHLDGWCWPAISSRSPI